MNAIRKTTQINNQELAEGTSISASWHNDYNDTAYIYIGGLESKLTEMDIATVFSQFGNPTHVKLSRDQKTGKSRGFAWLKYEDQRSTVLAVDNFNGVELLGRTMRVDHTYYESRDEEGDAKEVEMLNKARNQRLGRQSGDGGGDERNDHEDRSRDERDRRSHHSSRDRSPNARDTRERRSHRSSRDRSPGDRQRSHRRSRRSRDDDNKDGEEIERSRRSLDDMGRIGGERNRRGGDSKHDGERSSRRSRDDGSSRRSRRSRGDGSRERSRKQSRRDRSTSRDRSGERESETARGSTKLESTANQDPDLVDPMAAYFADKK
ncbi:hypothetical protein B0I72DRAFT_135840 [Yarrowia lipolytica]|uniref:Uncharacterized protein n=1 Tax=Yarrowia lipolytica TaxID=4952 RepID=A0A371C060_YARLL|nr:U2 snRNP component IST3 [Yarrowia lipolytica]RDW23721.1 hypothetical protein B0I71DRAFT_135473 [Yarrowia lipolytica]RDW33791.1 hypothetical protein B0I72DRAFT_135840 [Yarrowia lipolytica]RDW37471.1 hypothetical protein B0I73DRAFT_135444 [Yarrowia lipolytica]SEI34013.1 YALIA101S04e08086g1_1 [Yarrowia lipolytica]